MPAPAPEPAPEPEPAVAPATFRAVEGDGGPLLEDPVLWDISGASGAVADGLEGNPVTLELPGGTYSATAYRLAAGC